MRRLKARELAIREVLREARLQAGLSQRELSLKLREAPNWVGRMESLVRGISFAQFFEVADALKQDPRDLVDAIVKKGRRTRGKSSL